jgi:SAM-dependent methyltransferase
MGIKGFLGYFQSYYHRIFRPTFKFRGKLYHYFCHEYNRTWRNERVVEIPIIWDMVKKQKGRVLEVGNVLSHYFSVNHNIVDRYERAGNVINEDIVDFNPEEKYDLIVSISTLEHIGWDEPEKLEPKKILDAMKNLKRCLTKNGRIVITLPVGYNRFIDELMRSGRLFTRFYCLKRISFWNNWVETDWDGIKDKEYDKPYPFANGLIIGVVE